MWSGSAAAKYVWNCYRHFFTKHRFLFNSSPPPIRYFLTYSLLSPSSLFPSLSPPSVPLLRLFLSLIPSFPLLLDSFPLLPFFVLVSFFLSLFSLPPSFNFLLTYSSLLSLSYFFLSFSPSYHSFLLVPSSPLTLPSSPSPL